MDRKPPPTIAASEAGTTKASGSPSLTDLPKVVIVYILQFLDKINDLLSCEQTCKVLQAAVLDDRSWSCLRPFELSQDVAKTNGYESIRDFHHCRQAMLNVSAYQNATTHPQHIVQVLGDDGWKNLVKLVLRNDTRVEKIELRGDAAFVLAELLESSLVSQLSNAAEIALDRSRRLVGSGNQCDLWRCSKAILDADDFVLQSKLTETDSELFAYQGLWKYDNTWKSQLADIMPEDVRYRLVRRLACVAGMPRIQYEVHDAVWNVIFIMMAKVMDHILILSVQGSGTPSCLTLRKLTNVKDIRDIPPFPRLVSASETHFTVVPGQIEMAFKHIYGGVFAYKCYGSPWTDGATSFWHLSRHGNTVEEEMNEAMAAYDIDSISDEGVCMDDSSIKEFPCFSPDQAPDDADFVSWDSSWEDSSIEDEVRIRNSKAFTYSDLEEWIDNNGTMHEVEVNTRDVLLKDVRAYEDSDEDPDDPNFALCDLSSTNNSLDDSNRIDGRPSA